MKQGANKKRGTFATKIIVMVILAVIFLKAPKNKLQTVSSIQW